MRGSLVEGLEDISEEEQGEELKTQFQDKSKGKKRETRKELFDRNKEFKKQDLVGKKGDQMLRDDERFSISPVVGSCDEIKPIDLKYKLKSLRDAKKPKLTKVFCHACNTLTKYPGLRNEKELKYYKKHVLSEKDLELVLIYGLLSNHQLSCEVHAIYYC